MSNMLKEKGHTKLKFTVASFIVHILISLGFILKGFSDPALWGVLFASFNGIFMTYSASKTYKDKVIISNKE